MKVIQEKDIRSLYSKKKVFTEAGKKVNLAAKRILSIEDRQEKTIKQATQAVAMSTELSKKSAEIASTNAAVLREIFNRISQIKPQEITIPEQIKKWKFVVQRNNDGFIKEIIAEKA